MVNGRGLMLQIGSDEEVELLGHRFCLGDAPIFSLKKILGRGSVISPRDCSFLVPGHYRLV